MANKYIDHLTLEEYKQILVITEDKLKQLNNKITPNEKNSVNAEYVKLRFLILKIKAIIKKYEKD